jgi:hypothetical protein
MASDSIELTPDEARLVSQTEFTLAYRSYTELFAVYCKNKEAIRPLMRSLLCRDAILPSRLALFKDSRYRVQLTNHSVEKEFELNGTRGEEIYIHPGFLTYLRYFLFGADLPNDLISEFAQEVDLRRPLSSHDLSDLGALARQLSKRFNLDPTQVATEFYRLSVDLGLDPNSCRTIHDGVNRN